MRISNQISVERKCESMKALLLGVSICDPSASPFTTAFVSVGSVGKEKHTEKDHHLSANAIETNWIANFEVFEEIKQCCNASVASSVCSCPPQTRRLRPQPSPPTAPSTPMATFEEKDAFEDLALLPPSSRGVYSCSACIDHLTGCCCHFRSLIVGSANAKACPCPTEGEHSEDHLQPSRPNDDCVKLICNFEHDVTATPGLCLLPQPIACCSPPPLSRSEMLCDHGPATAALSSLLPPVELLAPSSMLRRAHNESSSSLHSSVS